MMGSVRVVFLTMLGAVGFVLMIAARANVANMMLGRSITRGREFRGEGRNWGHAPGSSCGRSLSRAWSSAPSAGPSGFCLAAFGVHVFDLALQDVGPPYWIQFRMDWEVYGYFAAVTILTRGHLRPDACAPLLPG